MSSSATPPNSNSATNSKGTPVAYRLRQDIRWQSSDDKWNGSNTRIAYDALSRRMFRCGEHEYQLLNWLSTSSTLEELADRFRAEFAPRHIEFDQIQQLLSKAYSSGLLRPTSESTQIAIQNAQMPLSISERGMPDSLASRKLASRSPFGYFAFVRWLAFKIVQWTQAQFSLGSPDRLLAVIAPFMGFLYSGAAACLWMTLACLAIGLTILRWDAFVAELPSFQSLRSPAALVGFGVVFVVTRFFHELGHAVVCKRAGASCRDVGIIMSFGMMCPYVDISDGWRLGNRFSRMAIAMAGIYTEIILASLSALVWLSTHPGWLHDLSLNTMLVCSITTILFNANPLMKYDGYFLLCDWVGIQNLRDKAFLAMDGLLEFKSSNMPFSRSLWLTAYFLASTLNRLILTFGLASMVYAMSYQWNVAGLGVAFIFVYLMCNGIIAMAAWTQSNRASSGSTLRNRRAVWIGWITVGVLCSWIVNMPLPNRVHTWGTFQTGLRQAVYAAISGRVESVLGSDTSTEVDSDTAILNLRDEHLERTLMDLQSMQIQVTQQIATLERLSYFEQPSKSTRTASKPMLYTRRDQLEKQLKEKREELLQLSISPRVRGIFEPALAKPADFPINPAEQAFKYIPSQMLSRMTWTESQALGRYVERGTLIGWIIDDSKPMVECTLSEEQMVDISVGTEVRVRLEQIPYRLFHGKVYDIARTSRLDKTSTHDKQNQMGAVSAVNYQLLVEMDLENRPIRYASGNAEVVIVRPNVSLFNMATDQWLRNVRIR